MANGPGASLREDRGETNGSAQEGSGTASESLRLSTTRGFAPSTAEHARIAKETGGGLQHQRGGAELAVAVVERPPAEWPAPAGARYAIDQLPNREGVLRFRNSRPSLFPRRAAGNGSMASRLPALVLASGIIDPIGRPSEVSG